MAPRETETAFLRMLHSKRNVTAEDIFRFIDANDSIVFGPKFDAIDLIKKYLDLGVIEYDKHASIFHYKGFNANHKETSKEKVRA